MSIHGTGPRQPTPLGPNTDSVPTPPSSTNANGPLASQFNTSPLPWNAHFSGGTTTTTTTATTVSTATVTTTTPSAPSSRSNAVPSDVPDPALNPSNSSSGQVASSATNVPARVTPPWQKDLPEGFLRGDECFRQRYGDDVSLLDDDNLFSTRFTRNANKCHPRLRRDAEGLAASMQIRNYAVADLITARAKLKEAETALQGEKTRFELSKAAAQRNDFPLGEAAFKMHDKALAELTRRRDAARELCDKDALDLEEIQESLVNRHAKAETRTALSDEKLDSEIEIVADPEIDMDEDEAEDMNPAMVEERGVLELTLAIGTFGGVATAIVRQMYFNISLELARTGFETSPEMQANFLEREALAMDLTRVARDLIGGFFVVGAMVFVLLKLRRI